MNTTLKITQTLVPSNKYSIKCPYKMTPQFIVIHNTANDASAMSEISYMIGNNKEVSFHYAVDGTRAVQGIPLNRNAWHAGDGGSGKGNRNGIAIEICYSKSGGKNFVAAQQNAALLAAKLLKKYGWGIDKVKKHQDFSGKYCPHRTLNDYGWTWFKNLVQKYLNELNRPAKTSTKVDAAQSKASCPAGGKKFKTTDALNLRVGAGTNKALITTLKQGTTVTWYGYYTTVSGYRWYLVAVDGKTGYVHSGYLKAV